MGLYLLTEPAHIDFKNYSDNNFNYFDNNDFHKMESEERDDYQKITFEQDDYQEITFEQDDYLNSKDIVMRNVIKMKTDKNIK